MRTFIKVSRFLRVYRKIINSVVRVGLYYVFLFRLKLKKKIQEEGFIIMIKNALVLFGISFYYRVLGTFTVPNKPAWVFRFVKKPEHSAAALTGLLSAEVERKRKSHSSGRLPSKNSGSEVDPFEALCESQPWSKSQKVRLDLLYLFLECFKKHPQKATCRRMICKVFHDWVRGYVNEFDAFVDLCLWNDWSESQADRLVKLYWVLQIFDNHPHRAEFRRIICEGFAEWVQGEENKANELESDSNSDSDD
uniref:Uncharacterized protein n=1 Tax=Lobelia spicata TaxID=1441989 RepID=A0A291F091_9ASTR|nr:hypothetical protein Lo_spi1Pt0021 [Lobelia spicata]ATG25560.1 hypothetical protein Lo_spi1Pt0021 [Lobelia spicata]